MNFNILIVGVGGQGTLLASRVLGELAAILSLDCKLSEVHGMAQRGGSVVTHVRIGEKVFSPIIYEGNADIIIAFEELEALRWRHFLKKDGIMLINSQEIYPMPVIIGDKTYPANIIDTIKNEGKRVIALNALKIAENVGNTKTVNTVMLGALAKIMNLPYENINKAIIEAVPKKVLEVNEKALSVGYELVKGV